MLPATNCIKTCNASEAVTLPNTKNKIYHWHTDSSQFAHAARPINLIEIGRNRFMLGLALITDCGLTSSVVWTRQQIPPQRTSAHFVRLSPCAKTQSVRLADCFVAQTVTIGKQKIRSKSDIFKRIFTDSYYSRPNSFRLARPDSGSSFSPEYVGNMLMFYKDTRNTEIVKCINNAQPEPEPCYKKHSSGAEAMLTKTELRRRSRSQFIFTRAQQPWSKGNLSQQRMKHWAERIFCLLGRKNQLLFR